MQHFHRLFYYLNHTCRLNQTMDALVERWRKNIKSSERKSLHTPALENTVEVGTMSLHVDGEAKKEEKKKKRKRDQSDSAKSPKQSKSTHTQPATTPQPPPKSQKNRIIEDFTKRIEMAKSSEQTIRLQLILEEFWLIVQDNVKEANLQLEPPPPLSQSRDTPSKIQTKIHADLQNRYFSCQKQRQYLKAQLEETTFKYQYSCKEVERLVKIQKLIDNCLRREDLLNKEIQFLRVQLKTSEEKEVEQQRVFKREVLVIHELIESIKESLPT